MINEWIEENKGEFISAGMSRRVFEWTPDPTLVLKHAHDRWVDANQGEARVWEQAPELLRRALAPVTWVSPCGSYLLMKKAKTLTKMKYLELARSLVHTRNLEGVFLPPALSWDLHRGNWGVIEGKPVLIDYTPFTSEKVVPEDLRVERLWSYDVLEKFQNRVRWELGERQLQMSLKLDMEVKYIPEY